MTKFVLPLLAAVASAKLLAEPGLPVPSIKSKPF